MNRTIFFILLSTGTAQLQALFDHAQIARAYATGDVAKAQVKNDLLLTESPQDPVILYNAGKIAAKQSQLEKAQNYFEQAVFGAQEAGNKQLQEQAQFDSGTALAMQKKYEEAVSAYQKVLDLNPENKFAQENKAAIEELLKKQEEQQQSDQQKQDKKEDSNQDSEKQNKDQKDGDNKENEDKSDGKQEQNEQQNKGDDQGNSNKKPGSDQNNSENNADESKEQDADKPNESSESQNGSDDKKSGDDKKQNAEQQLQDQLKKEQEGAGKQQGQQQPGADKKEEKQAVDAQKSEAQQQKAEPGKMGPGQQQAQGAQTDAQLGSQGAADLPLDDRQKRLLSLVEQADEQAGKNLVQRSVAARMKGSSGEKNW